MHDYVDEAVRTPQSMKDLLQSLSFGSWTESGGLK